MSVNFNEVLHTGDLVRITTDRATVDHRIFEPENGITVKDLLTDLQEILDIPEEAEFKVEIRSQEREYIVTNTD